MTRDYDALTNSEAEVILDDLYAQNPEVVAVVIETTLIASPQAGPIRILREVDAIVGEEAI